MNIKNRNIRRKVVFIITVLAVALSSCNKWLDLQPETEISADKLFNTEEGFEESLDGVYTRCTQSDLYGLELTMLTPEVLAQNYSVTAQDHFGYKQTSLYNYSDGDFRSRKDNFWSGLYNGIVNCNLILENIDQHEKIFTGNNYKLIKGEALALRAYLHFDLLRLFAPSYKRSPGGAAIPYVTTYSKDITALSTVSEVLDKTIGDLEAAKVLLKDSDPILSPGYVVGYPTDDTTKSTEEKSNILFLQNRRHHMNYYAVCGELARVYLYKEDKANALKNALEVINSNKFPWTTQADFLAVEESKKDRILYKELVFGWYIPGSRKDLLSKFPTGLSGLFIDEDAMRSMYETGGIGGNDQRASEGQWFHYYTENATKVFDIYKYKRNSTIDNSSGSADDDAPNKAYSMAPAIRLSEMYYIAAECSYAANPQQALAYVDTVRQKRGIEAKLQASSEDAFLAELVKECRKEWYAEGQIFYMYKRLNRPIQGQQGATIPASDKIFVLPMPDDEVAYGGR